MRRIMFIELRNGRLLTCAPQIDKLLLELGLPLNSIFADGKAHPGTQLNGLAEKLYSPEYSTQIDMDALQVFFVADNQGNKAFLKELLDMPYITKQTVHEKKLDCYTPEFLEEIIKYLCAIAGVKQMRAGSDYEVYTKKYRGKLPLLEKRVRYKPTTAAKPLINFFKQEEEEVKQTVISKFIPAEQEVIRRYTQECNKTLEERRRARENGKT